MIYELDGIQYDVVITHKRNKNIYLRVKDDLKIYISCSPLVSKKEILKLLNQNEKFIRKNIEKIKNKQQKAIKNYYLGQEINVILMPLIKGYKLEENNLIIKDENELVKFYKDEAKRIFQLRLKYIYHLFKENIPYPKLKIRKMKTRWGVCNRKNKNITLNLDLIEHSLAEIDYVIIHELAHFVHFNHSKDFWQLVEQYCVDYKKIRKILKY